MAGTLASAFKLEKSAQAGKRVLSLKAQVAAKKQLQFFYHGQRMSNRSAYDSRKYKRLIMTDTQLELGFGRANESTNTSERQGQLPCANGWVTRMREIAERVFDWQPNPPPRPVQTYFVTNGR